MKLRRFNRDGVNAFINYRDQLTTVPNLPPPWELLESPALTEQIGEDIEVQNVKFSNRAEAGKYLYALINAAQIPRPEGDQGLWTWLTLFYFDAVCPADGNGNRKVDDMSRLVAQVDNYQRFYRHLLLGPFLIVRAHADDPDRAIAYLCNPLSGPGEIVEQLASRKELVTNRAVAEAATLLYYDKSKSTFKHGAGGKTKGAPRRLAALLNQLDLTYYLYGMTAKELLALLPKEFDRFRPS